MSLLNMIMKYSPPTWVPADYTDVTYRIFDLDSWEKEYIDIKFDLGQKGFANIKSIARIQHAYAYSQYAVRMEHLTTFLCDDVFEVRTFLLLEGSESEAKSLIKFNGDLRRGANIAKSNPKYIIIMKILKHSTFPRDSDRYPEYFITMQ